MKMEEKVEIQKEKMDRIIEWVKTCDTKTSIVMTIALLVPSFLIGTDWVLERSERIITPLAETIFNMGKGYCFSWTNCIALILLVLTLVLLGKSLSKFIKVLVAKTKENTFGNDVKEDSLIHFHYISMIKDFQIYKQKVEEAKDEDYYEDLLSQTYINAKRCNEKFNDYNAGVRWLCGAMISLVFFMVSLFFVL